MQERFFTIADVLATANIATAVRFVQRSERSLFEHF